MSGSTLGKYFLTNVGVDDRDGHAACDIGFGEGAAARDANAESVEISGSDHVEAGAGSLRAIGDVLADDIEGHAEIGALHRHAGGDGNAGYAGQGVNSLDQLAIESDHLLGLGPAVGGHRQTEGENVIGAEAHVHVGEIPEAVNGEAGCREQRERESEFRKNERVADTMFRGADPAAAAFLERVIEIQPCGLKRRGATEENAGEHGGGHREQQHRNIQVTSASDGSVKGGISARIAFRSPREPDAERATDGGERETFRQELAEELAARGAQSAAHGDFALACGAAGEQKLATLAQAISRTKPTAPSRIQRARIVSRFRKSFCSGSTLAPQP